jgi:four helix bundle protein
MNYEEWEAAVPETITADSLWKMQAYRLALFLADIGWHDVTKLMRDRRTVGLADQLYRSLGSVGANLAEGYSRGTGKDRAHFYEYSLGSARESRDWYYKGRHVLGETAVQHRMDLLAQVIRLLLTMVPQQRQRVLREESATYQVESDASLDSESLACLLRDAPLPEL